MSDIKQMDQNVVDLAKAVAEVISQLQQSIKTLQSTTYKMAGSVNSLSELNAITNASPGDVYNVQVEGEDGMNYVYTKENTWDALGVDIYTEENSLTEIYKQAYK